MAAQQKQSVDIVYCVLKQVSVLGVYSWASLTGLRWKTPLRSVNFF